MVISQHIRTNMQTQINHASSVWINILNNHQFTVLVFPLSMIWMNNKMAWIVLASCRLVLYARHTHFIGAWKVLYMNDRLWKCWKWLAHGMAHLCGQIIFLHHLCGLASINRINVIHGFRINCKSHSCLQVCNYTYEILCTLRMSHPWDKCRVAIIGSRALPV